MPNLCHLRAQSPTSRPLDPDAINKQIEQFTVGKDRELDLLLAKHDITGTLAHITMLESIQLLTKEELDELIAELRRIYQSADAGDFVIEDGVEDVHSQVELMLTQRLGDVGKKIHSGRSRNDQVLVDLKLFTRTELREVVELIVPLFKQLLSLSEQYKNVLIPGYTHYQVAMPSSFGLWFGAYAESLVDDMHSLLAAFKITNKNPLGSAAGYGSSFPLNRNMTTELLGFDDLNYNVVYAQMGRGKTERSVAQAISSVAATLSKMAQDICLYNSQNFSFVKFPDHLTTGSSIMPHKKNPDVFELIRAKCNKMMALPVEISMITNNLSSGYHRDLQIIKESFLPVFEEIKSCLYISKYMLENIIINDGAIKEEKYKYIFSVDVVNKLVLEGMSFRDAYKQVGLDIEAGTFEPIYDLKHSHEGSMGNLCNHQIEQLMESVLAGFSFQKMDTALASLLGNN
jgi:argininosuccinate lyase